MAGKVTKGHGSRGATTGSIISRRLKAAGVGVSPAARRHRYDGLYVTGNEGRATVMVTLGNRAANEAAANLVLRTVSGWDIRDLSASDVDGEAIVIRFKV